MEEAATATGRGGPVLHGLWIDQDNNEAQSEKVEENGNEYQLVH